MEQPEPTIQPTTPEPTELPKPAWKRGKKGDYYPGKTVKKPSVE